MSLVGDVFGLERFVANYFLRNDPHLSGLEFEEAKGLILKRKAIEASALGIGFMVCLASAVYAFAIALFACNVPGALLSGVISFFWYEAVAFSYAERVKYRDADQWEDVVNIRELQKKIVLVSGANMRDNLTLVGKGIGRQVDELVEAENELGRVQQQLHRLQREQQQLQRLRRVELQRQLQLQVQMLDRLLIYPPMQDLPMQMRQQ